MFLLQLYYGAKIIIKKQTVNVIGVQIKGTLCSNTTSDQTGAVYHKKVYESTPDVRHNKVHSKLRPTPF